MGRSIRTEDKKKPGRKKLHCSFVMSGFRPAVKDIVNHLPCSGALHLSGSFSKIKHVKIARHYFNKIYDFWILCLSGSLFWKTLVHLYLQIERLVVIVLVIVGSSVQQIYKRNYIYYILKRNVEPNEIVCKYR